MNLSKYQGNSMTIKYAHRRTDASKLSKLEIELLKSKGEKEILQKFGVIPEKVPKEGNKRKHNKADVDESYWNTALQSAQKHLNKIALSCLECNKKDKIKVDADAYESNLSSQKHLNKIALNCLEYNKKDKIEKEL
jgi:hypothetical protein